MANMFGLLGASDAINGLYAAQVDEMQRQFQNQRMGLASLGAAQAGLGGAGLGSYEPYRREPEIRYKADPKNIMEELQAEVDEWLKDVF